MPSMAATKERQRTFGADTMKAGTVVWVDSGEASGFKVRPCVVLDDSGDEVRVVHGTSQKTKLEKVYPYEVLVNAPWDMKSMGLTKTTKFGAGNSHHWVRKHQIAGVSGMAPPRILSMIEARAH